MKTDKQLLEQSLHALQTFAGTIPGNAVIISKAIEDIEARLAEPEDEPVAWLASAKDGDDDCLYWDGEDARIDGYAFVEPLYRHPPRPVRLSDDEVSDFAREMVKGGKSVNWLARAIESAILEKNR
jgi:hypothetical protein